MKKYLVPVAVAMAAFGNANADQNTDSSEIMLEKHHNDEAVKDQGSSVLTPLLMIPAVASIDTITQLPQHRSHSSHGSHRSHYSSRY